MATPSTILDGRTITISLGGVTVAFDLYDALDAASDEDRIAIAQAVGWGPVLDEAAKRLAGEFTGDWSGHDWIQRHAFLAAVESEVGTELTRLRKAEEDARWFRQRVSMSRAYTGGDALLEEERQLASRDVDFYLRRGERPPEPDATQSA